MTQTLNIKERNALCNLASQYDLSLESLQEEYIASRDNYANVQEYIDQLIDNGDYDYHATR